MTKPITILIFFILTWQLTQAQVGINTMTPKPSAALDIRSIEKGLLIPCMSSDNRLNIVDPADGLMVYDTIQHTFYFWDKSKSAWYSLNPWSYRSPESNGTSYDLYTLLNANVGIGVLVPQAKLHVNGDVRINNNLQVNQNATVSGNMSATTFTGNGAGITNVDAATLNSHDASYFGTAAMDNSLNTNKLDKSSFYPEPIAVTATQSGSYTTLNYYQIKGYVLGNMVFVSGSVSFTKTRSEVGASFVLSGLPDFPSCFGCNQFTYNLSWPSVNYTIGYGFYDKSSTVGNQNTIIFYRAGDNLGTGIQWSARFQFFYWINQ